MGGEVDDGGERRAVGAIDAEDRERVVDRELVPDAVPAQARRVGDMAAVGTGGVYWRLSGTGRQGKEIRSQTFYVNVTD